MKTGSYFAREKPSLVYRKANILDLIKKNKLEEKKEKRVTTIIAATALSLIVLSGIIITH